MTEAKIDDEEVSMLFLEYQSIHWSSDCILTQEFKAQCFGGEFTGEVYDHVLKK